MKICHVTSAHNRYDIRIFQKECISLARNKYDVYLLVNDKYNDEVVENVNIISSGFNPKNRKQRFVDCHKLIFAKMLMINADIYHFHDPDMLPLMKKIKRRGKIVIFDSHEDYPTQILNKDYIPKIFRKIVAYTYKMYETHVVKGIDAVIFPCKINGKHPFEKRCKNIFYIDNVPKLEIFNLKEVDRCRVGEFTACYIGTLAHNRGVTASIKAAYLANVKLVLAGNFSSENYKQEVMKMPEFSCVDYRGYCSWNEIKEIYNVSSVGLATVLNIGQYKIQSNLLTKTYEYMAMGLPVIANESIGMKEANKEYGFAILVDSENPQEIVDAIKSLKGNPEMARKMGENGMRAIKEKYNWKEEEKKLIELYQIVNR